MNHTWSKGFDQKQKRKKDLKLSKSASQTLPPISQPGSPASQGSPGSPGAQISPVSPGSPGPPERTMRPMLGASHSEPALSGKTQRQRIAECIDRQTSPTQIQGSRLAFNQTRRQYHGESKDADNEFLDGSKGAQGFRLYLIKKYGSIIAGWRMVDLDNSGRLSFYEFCNACRLMGYSGNIKGLWAELDKDCSGQVTLTEIDPEVGNMVGKFKHALLAEYGDMLTAWQKGVDVNGNGKIDENEIVDVVKRLKIPVNGKKLFKCFTLPGRQGITLEDFDPDAFNRWKSGDHQGLTSKANTEFLDDVLDEDGNPLAMPEHAVEKQSSVQGEGATKQAGAHQWRAELRRRDKEEMQNHLDQQGDLRAGLCTLQGFKKALIARCGSLYRAWTDGFDISGRGFITFGEFTQGIDKLSFQGDIQGLWVQLLKNGNAEDQKKNGNAEDQKEQKRTNVVFGDLDPETDQNLNDLRTKLAEKHGNMLLAWVKGMDTNGSGKVSKEEFVACCADVGCTFNSEKLFQKMQPAAGVSRESRQEVGGINHLTLKNFDVKAHNAMLRGDMRMLSEGECNPHAGKKPTDLSFHERQENCFQYQIKKAQAIAQSEEFRKGCKWEPPDHVLDTAEEFEGMCKRTYGSIIAAWRQCLDLDANGKLTFNEFCKALRRLGYAGDYTSLWNKYGGKQKGHLALKDIDPEADEIVTSFLQLLSTQYGTLDDAWKLGFNKDPHEQIDEEELAEACKKLEYKYPAKKIWRCLQAQPGKQLLTIWDLDPFCTRKKQRGEEAFFATSKSALSDPTAKKSEFGSGKQAKEEAAKAGKLKPSEKKHESDVQAGSAALPNLRQVFRQKYGSTLTGWRVSMDPKGSGTVSFGNFVLALEDCSFKGNVKAMWKVIAGDRGTAAFREIDPDSQAMVDAFRDSLLGRCGSLLEAWKTFFNTAGVGRISEDEFTQAVESEGFAVKAPKKLFQSLKSQKYTPVVNEQDFMGLLVGLPTLAEREHAWVGGAQPAEAGGGAASPPSSPLAKAKAKAKAAAEGASRPAKATSEKATSAASQEPKQASGKLQVCIVRATGLSTSTHPSPAKDPFCTCTVVGKAESKFQTEPGTSATDPVWKHGPIEITEFKEGDSLEFEVWDRAVPSNGEAVDRSFGKATLDCKLFQFPQKFEGQLELTGSNLFTKGLDLFTDLGKLEVRVMDPVLAEDISPPASPSSPSSKRKQIPPPSPSRTGNYASPTNRSVGAPSDRDFAKAQQADWHGRDKVVNDVDGLKRALIAKYGSCFSAWRTCLDSDNKGRMSQADFTIACNSLGIKAVKRLWNELEPTGRGAHVYLKDLDLATDDAFRELEERILSEYPNSKVGWTKVFDPKNTKRVDFETFKAGCERLHYSGNPDKTFKLLRPFAGAKHMSYEDLWPNFDRNENFPHAEPSKPGSKIASPRATMNMSSTA